MAKISYNIRIESWKLEKLKNIAKNTNQNCSELLRAKIEEIITNGYDEDTLIKVSRIVAELRGPFAYFKTQQGKIHAKKERIKREEIANKIEKIFKLGGKK